MGFYRHSYINFFAVIVSFFGLKSDNRLEDEHEDSEYNYDDYYAEEETNYYLEQEKAREEEEEEFIRNRS